MKLFRFHFHISKLEFNLPIYSMNMLEVSRNERPNMIGIFLKFPGFSMQNIEVNSKIEFIYFAKTFSTIPFKSSQSDQQADVSH